MITATIKETKPFAKFTSVTVEAEGKQKTYKFWNDAGFASEMQVGAEIKFSAEVKDSINKDPDGNPYKDHWLTEVNGKPAKAARSAGGGGGGRPPQQPKDEASIAAQVVIKEAMNGAIASNPGKPVDVDLLRNLAVALTSAFLESYKAIKGANGS